MWSISRDPIPVERARRPCDHLVALRISVAWWEDPIPHLVRAEEVRDLVPWLHGTLASHP